MQNPKNPNIMPNFTCNQEFPSEVLEMLNDLDQELQKLSCSLTQVREYNKVDNQGYEYCQWFFHIANSTEDNRLNLLKCLRSFFDINGIDNQVKYSRNSVFILTQYC